MKVAEETKNAYSQSSDKKLNILFPELSINIPMSQIYSQSMNLVEMLIDRDNIEFVGCISSKFEIQLSGLPQNIKGKKIEISINANETEDIPLFKGIVDNAKRQTNKNYKKIVAYDELYTRGNIDVSAWYNNLTFPISIGDIRNSLFEYIGLEQTDIELPNDNIAINKEYAPTSLKALSVIKAICQINGAFGIVNRYGKFEYRILKEPKSENGAFPGLTLFPPFYPGVIYEEDGNKIEVKDVPFYKKVDYEEYSVKPVEKVTIRQTDSDVGVTYGDGTNNYIIQGNIFTLNMPEDTLSTIAKNVYENISNIEFVPFSSDNSGYPFVEVGLDAVSYYAYNFEASARARSADVYTKKTFHVFKRTLSGIQALKDSYEAQGEEYQQEFVTDVGTQIERLKNNLSSEVNYQVREFTYPKSELDEKIIKVISVPALPANPLPNTIYLIQGEVVVE